MMRMYSLKSVGITDDHPAAKRFAERVHTVLKFMDDRLSQAKWLAGDEFTAAEIMTLLCVTTLRQYAPLNLQPYPNILRWAKECATRPGYLKAMEKGDPSIDIDAQLKGESPAQFPGIKQAQLQAQHAKLS
jgi:glutathione S-transferase